MSTGTRLLTWHAVLAPLGALSLDGRMLAHDSSWLVKRAEGDPTRVDYVPLLLEVENSWQPVGRVLAVGHGHGLLVATGVIVDVPDDDGIVTPIRKMRDGSLWPQFDVSDAAENMNTVWQPGGEEPVHVFYGGIITAVRIGDAPAWNEARFTISEEKS